MYYTTPYGAYELKVSQGYWGDLAALVAAVFSAANILAVKQLRHHFEAIVAAGSTFLETI